MFINIFYLLVSEISNSTKTANFTHLYLKILIMLGYALRANPTYLLDYSLFRPIILAEQLLGGKRTEWWKQLFAQARFPDRQQ